MLSLLLLRRSKLLYASSTRPFSIPAPLKPPALIHHSYSSQRNPNRPHRFRRKRSDKAPPPPDQAEIDRAIASLPARFADDDLAAAISSHPDPRLALPLISWASSLPHPRSRPGSAAFLSAVRRLFTARLYPEMSTAASLTLSLRPLPSDPSLLPSLLYFFSQSRMLSKAIHVYTLMRSHDNPSCRPTPATFNTLFTALLGRDGANSYINHVYMDTIRTLFRQMVDSGVAPDIHALNSMVKGYALSLHLNDALRVFHQMVPVYGVEPDGNTYSYLIHGLCAQARTRNARELYDEMRKRGLVPSGRAWNSLACAVAMEGEVEEAVELVREMGRAGRAPDLVTCRTVLGEMWGRGRGREAAVVLEELRDGEFVDGRAWRELLHWMQDEFGGGGDGRHESALELRSL